MDFSTNSTSINMNMYIQPANLPIKDISEFPSKQAEALQKHLLELDKQGKLKEEFLNRYGNNLGKPNSLANYILEDFENRKHLSIQWTGVEVYNDKHTILAIGIKLNEVSKGSGRYFLWKCSTCGYEWVAKIAGRTYTKSGCPKCGYRKRAEALQLQGEPLDAWCNRQGEYGEKIRKEFVGELADGTKISINSISRGSKQEVYWKCSNKDCSYKWKATPNSRTYIKRQGCPACAKIKMAEAAHLKGETLERWCNVNGKYGKQLKEEFIGLDEDNKQIALVDISRGGRQKVWWRCSKCNYKWTAMIADRTNSNKSSGCPACAGKICIPGKNDLETYCHQHPELNYILEEFVGLDENNQHILPSEVARGSIKKVLFECNKCHKRWLATPNDRTGTIKRGCPHCCNIGTSFPEQYIYQSLKQLFPDTLNRAKEPIHNFEYDITIPSLRLCIEYSGYSWHQDKLERDKLKEEHCKHNNVQFLQIYAHSGNIKDTDGNIAQDTYTPNQILYKVERDKALHIIQLQQIIKFILEQYAPKHSIEEIDFTLVEQEASKVMNKA